MSSVNRDMVEGYRDLAVDIKEYLKKERTPEELKAFLENVAETCDDNYNKGGRSLGWF